MHTTRRTMADARGWSLVESLVSCVLLTTAGAVVATALSQGMRLGRMTSDYYAAVGIAKNRIERVRGFDFEDIGLLGENDVRLDHFGRPNPRGDFLRTTEVDAFHGQLLGRVTTRVSYPVPGLARRAEVEVVTLLTDRNPGGCSP